MHNKVFKDEKDIKNYIDKEDILEKVSQEEIFALVFGFIPSLDNYVTSPFRKDTQPGCWFEYNKNGKLRFMDWANPTKQNGIRLDNMDCFDAVQVFFRISNFYQTLVFITENLIRNPSNCDLFLKKKLELSNMPDKKPVLMTINPREYQVRDIAYWNDFEITPEQLNKDKVYPISGFTMINTKNGSLNVKTYDLAYAYTEFSQDHKKVYRPHQNKRNRFWSNTTANDIGSVDHLMSSGRQMIISKSFKDCRVLRNQGLNCIWFQNEGMIPSPELIIPVMKRFDKVVLFFDNDNTGMESSKKVSSILNSHCPNKVKTVHLPLAMLSNNIKDPADLIKGKGRTELKKFLTYEKLIL